MQSVSWSSTMKSSRWIWGSRISVHTMACAILCARKNGVKSARYSGAGAPRMYQATVVSRYIGLRVPIPTYQHRPHKEDERRMRRTRRAWYNRSSILVTPQAASALRLPSPLPPRHHWRHRHNLHRPPDRYPLRSHNTETQHPRPPVHTQRQCYRVHAKRLARVRVHHVRPCLCSGVCQRQPSRAAGARACLPPCQLRRGGETRQIRLGGRRCLVQIREARQVAGYNITGHRYPHPVSQPYLPGAAVGVFHCGVSLANISFQRRALTMDEKG